ncbi:MAG: hypothetical protein QXD77_00865, partial [Candidatus Aenigmatarchaeota archaeon]
WNMNRKGYKAVIACVMDGCAVDGVPRKGEDCVGAVEDFLFRDWRKLGKAKKGEPDPESIVLNKSDINYEHDTFSNVGGINVPPRKRLDMLEEAGFISMENYKRDHVKITRKIKSIR